VAGPSALPSYNSDSFMDNPPSPCFSVGQIVKFVAPVSDDECQERFKVLEFRGARVLVEFICDMSLRPTFVYLAADLVAE
jgi:hypothetical protein